MTDIIENEATEKNENTEVSAEASVSDIGTSEPKREVIFEEALEAILFAAGHPISYATLARVFDYTPGAIKNKVLRYAEKYNDIKVPRGVILITYADSCQLCTKQYYLNEIRDTLGIKKSGTLSTSAMEVLAIVAYNQPVTRIFVDTLRSVDSSYAMNSLIDRGLIECTGRLDVPGRPMLYGTTSDFLRSFGLDTLASLPATSDELMAMFQKARDKEEGEINDAEQLSMLDGEGNPIEGDGSTQDISEEYNTSESEDSKSHIDPDPDKNISDQSDEASAEDDIIDI